MGMLLATMCGLTGPVWGDEPSDFSSQLPRATSETESENSPLIGGGVHRPPDIGAGGTASPTPSIRSESPTGEPDIFPFETPVPSDPPHPPKPSQSGEEDAQPLGDPEFMKEPSPFP